MPINYDPPLSEGLGGNPPRKIDVRAWFSQVSSTIDANDIRSTRFFWSRPDAVTYVSALPSVISHVLNLNNGVIEVRGRGAAGDDPLYSSGDRWAVIARLQDTAAIQTLIDKAVLAERSSRWDADEVLTQRLAAEEKARAASIRDAGVIPTKGVGGTADAITADLVDSAPDQLSTTATVELIPKVGNTGPVTLALPGYGPWPVGRRAGSPLAAGDLKAGVSYLLRRWGNAWRLIGLVDSDVAASITSAMTASGKMFAGRQEAVDFGQDKLPASLRHILTIEDGYAVWRGHGWAENDPLFPTYPNWGVVQKWPLDGTLRATLRGLVTDIGVVTLTGIAQPTPNLITATIPARLVDLGVTKLTGATVIVVRPVVDTTGPVELTLTGGTETETLPLTDWGGQRLDAQNCLRAGRFYQFERYGAGWRLNAGGVYYSDVQAVQTRVAALENRRIVTHTGTTFSGTWMPAEAETIVQRSGIDTSIWMRMSAAPVDPTAGVYQQDRGGGWWERTLALSDIARDIATHGLIEVVMSGSANSVVATPRTPVLAAQGQMLLVTWGATSTGPMTLAFGNEAERPLLTKNGGTVPAGSVRSGGLALVRRFGDQWRIWADLSALDRVPALEAQLAAEVGTLGARITNEASRAAAAETAIRADLTAEQATRAAAIRALSERLDATDAAVITGIKGPYATADEALAATVDGDSFLIADAGAIRLYRRSGDAAQFVADWNSSTIAGEALATARQVSSDMAPLRGAVATDPIGGIIESGEWSPELWTSTADSQRARDLTPHGKTIVDGGLVLVPGETIWSRRAIRRPTATGPIDVQVVVQVSGLAEPDQTASIDVVSRRFDTYGGPSSTTWLTVGGLRNGLHVQTVRFGNADLAGRLLHRLGAKAALTNPQPATVRLLSLSFQDVVTPQVWSINDFNPPTGVGEDASDAFERAFAAIPSGLELSPNILDLGGRTWSVSRPVRTRRNYTGLRNGALTALGTAADWTTTEGASNADVRALHDMAGSGWTDPTARQMALFRPHGYRIYAEDVVFNCRHICGAVDDLTGNSLRLSRLKVNQFGVYGVTYLNGSGMQLKDAFFMKFDWSDPRIGSTRLNTGVAIFSVMNDGDFWVCGGFGGLCGFYQHRGGTLLIKEGHWWNSSGGLRQEIIGPKNAGDQVKISVFMSDTIDDMTWDGSLMSAEIGPDGFATMTFLKDWRPATPEVQPTTVYCAPHDRYCAIMKGWGSTWVGHYYDDGIYELWGNGHRMIQGRGLVNNGTRVQIQSLFDMVPTAAEQSLDGVILDMEPVNTASLARARPNPKNPAASWAAADRAFLRPTTYSENGLRHWSKSQAAQVLFGSTALVATEYAGRTGSSVLYGVNNSAYTIWSTTLTDANRLVWGGLASGHHFYRKSGGDAVHTLHGAADRRAMTAWITTVGGTEKTASAGASDGNFKIETGGVERLAITEAGHVLPALPAYADAESARAALPAGALYTEGRAVRMVTGVDLPEGPRVAAPNLGLYLSGQYYDGCLHGHAGTATVAGVAGHLVLSPFEVAVPLRIDQIGVSVTTGVDGALGRCVIYAPDARGWPGPLLFSGAEDLSFAAAGFAHHTLDLTLQPRRIYWLGAWHSSTATVRAIPVAATVALGLTGSTGNTYYSCLRRTISYGSPLPALWGMAVSDLANNVQPPSVRLRAA